MVRSTEIFTLSPHLSVSRLQLYPGLHKCPTPADLRRETPLQRAGRPRRRRRYFGAMFTVPVCAGTL